RLLGRSRRLIYPPFRTQTQRIRYVIPVQIPWKPDISQKHPPRVRKVSPRPQFQRSGFTGLARTDTL
ncbi:MAG TPA: hypothetical protein PLG59_11950, partial [bacterium]|nr:hypothetical protein [bacterium]